MTIFVNSLFVTSVFGIIFFGSQWLIQLEAQKKADEEEAWEELDASAAAWHDAMIEYRLQSDVQSR